MWIGFWEHTNQAQIFYETTNNNPMVNINKHGKQNKQIITRYSDIKFSFVHIVACDLFDVL